MSRACCEMARSSGAGFCGACGKPTAGGRGRIVARHGALLGASTLFLALLGAAASTRAAPEVAAAARAATSALEARLDGLTAPAELFAAAAAEPPKTEWEDEADAVSDLSAPPAPALAEERPAPTAFAPSSLPPAARSPATSLAVLTASASSYSATTSGGTTYGPWNATDGDPSTAWQVSDGGVGEWIEVRFPSEVTLGRVGVVPGYDKVVPDRFGDRWSLNNRVATATLFWEDSGSGRAVTFSDSRAMQWTDLGGVRTSWLRMRIDDVLPGSRWNDTLVSELAFEGWP